MRDVDQNFNLFISTMVEYLYEVYEIINLYENISLKTMPLVYMNLHGR